MIAKRILLAGTAVIAGLAAFPAAAQQQSLEDRIRALEQKLGQPAMPGDNRPVEERVKALEDALAAKTDDDQAVKTRLSTLEQQFADTVWSFDNGRPQVQSADGRFLMALRARIQFDTALFSQRSNINSTNAQFKDLASGAIVRRFYFGAEGRAFRDFWYEFRMDVGGANAEGNNAIVNLARVAYNYGNLAYPNEPHFRINAGVIQPLFTYGDSVSSASTTFLERGDTINTAIAGYGGDDHRRGIELTFQQADIFRPGDNLVVSAAYTGQPTTPPAGAPTNITDEGTQIVSRVAYRLWSDGFSNLQIGANFADIINLTGTPAPGGARTIALQDRPEIRVDGNRLVSTANSTILGASTAATNIPERGGMLWGLEGGGNFKNFFLYGEYMKFGVDRDVNCIGCTPFGGTPGVNPGDPKFSGWYVEGSWILTGETKTYSPLATNNEYATFNNPRVITPFDWNGGTWGAWELAARYSDLDLNWHEGSIGQTAAQAPVGGVRGGEEKIWTLGLNWYFNNNVLMRFNYLIVDVSKLGFVTAGGTTTLQQIGQNFNAFGMRLQYSN
jgi:phosphate-selective porin OprO/OprP